MEGAGAERLEVDREGVVRRIHESEWGRRAAGPGVQAGFWLAVDFSFRPAGLLPNRAGPQRLTLPCKEERRCRGAATAA